MEKVYFISGIDTNCGKTVVTGLLAKELKNKGVNVITQKLVQTGSSVSLDVAEHRKIMGIDIQDVDKQGITCPYLFKFPASPHLSAKLENQLIDCKMITRTTEELGKKYDVVLLEGAGGLFVPLNDSQLIIDYIKEMSYPLILVTSPKLGSINHTLMSLKLCKAYGINIRALVYNHFPNENDTITHESRAFFIKYLEWNHRETVFIDCPEFNEPSLSHLNIERFFEI